MSAEGLLPSSYDYTYTFKPCFYTLSSICSDIVRLGSETETVSIATFFSDLSMDQNVKGFGLHFGAPSLNTCCICWTVQSIEQILNPFSSFLPAKKKYLSLFFS